MPYNVYILTSRTLRLRHTRYNAPAASGCHVFWGFHVPCVGRRRVSILLGPSENLNKLVTVTDCRLSVGCRALSITRLNILSVLRLCSHSAAATHHYLNPRPCAMPMQQPCPHACVCVHVHFLLSHISYYYIYIYILYYVLIFLTVTHSDSDESERIENKITAIIGVY